VCRDLSGHLELRHQYDMGEVIENETDEQRQLERAIANSMGTTVNSQSQSRPQQY